jgi:Flp pilus assembly protein TadG
MVLFMLMVTMGGVAVDLMRYEATRTSLQNTLDRSTLAAAALTQQLNPTDVVNDYFAKAGLLETLTGVEITQGLNYRTVVADAEAATDPFFLHMIGVEEMDAPGHSMAEQRMTNVEITLVLDISGSMLSNSRLVNLKTAANEFVDTVLSSDDEDRISIAIVPFNGQVNLGAALAPKYNLQKIHGVAGVNCVDLPSSVFTTLDLSRTLALPMTAHADTYTTTSKINGYVNRTDSNAVPNPANRWCPPPAAGATNTVRLPTNSISALQTHITGLAAIGATSINAGMKWGMAMVDPSTRSIFTEFAGGGQIDAEFAGRPFDYTDPESMKVIVLMTDGEHFAEERVNDAYKTGLSPIYKSPNDSNLSIRFITGRPGISGNNQYWVPHLGTWRALPWTNSSNTGTATQMTWPQVWAEQSVQWVTWQLYARALGTNDSQRAAQYNTWIATIRQQTAVTAMNSQLQSLCAQAKTQGVTVYGIAFEAPSGGQTQISQCATSPAHYFNAAGLQIRSAFRAIASNISHLRLTQ